MDPRAGPVDGRVARRLVRLDNGRPVEDSFVVLGVELHEERLPFLDQLGSVVSMQ